VVPGDHSLKADRAALAESVRTWLRDLPLPPIEEPTWTTASSA
jgi:hypothetical protein